jgi:hypothetical protein
VSLVHGPVVHGNSASLSPPRTRCAVGGEAGRTWAVRPLRSMGDRCDEGQRERGATWFSPRVAQGGELPKVSRRQWGTDR